MGLVPRALWGRRGSRAGSGGSIIGVWGGETRESEVRCGAVGCCGVGLGLVWSPDLSPPPPVAPFTNQLYPLPPPTVRYGRFDPEDQRSRHCPYLDTINK